MLVLALVLALVEGGAARWRRGTSSGRRTSGRGSRWCVKDFL